MKRTYGMIDVMKFVAAFLVVAIHFPLFEDVNLYLTYYFTNVVCRLAVPFFFVCSGFFLADRFCDDGAVKRYVLRLLQLYAIWSFLYIPQSFYQYMQQGVGILYMIKEFLYKFFVTGFHTQFWYFPAIITAILIIWILKSKLHLRDGMVSLILATLYFTGVFGNAYYGFLVNQTSALTKIYEMYFSWFETTRNGLFMGAFYVFMGYRIKHLLMRKESLMKYHRLFICLAIIFLGGMLVERYWLKEVTKYIMGDMTFIMVPTVFFLALGGFSTAINSKWDSATRWLRSCSTLIFCAHMFVDFYLLKVVSMVGWSWMIEYSITRFFCIYTGSLVLSSTIIYLSEKKNITWLKRLY